MEEVFEMADVLNGKWLADKILDSLKSEVSALTAKRGRAPGLGVILVGDNPASKAYVSSKEKAALKIGFKTYNQKLPADISFAELEKAIRGFNAEPGVDGILLQLPIPKHLDSDKAIDLINPDKDADGLHPFNQGLLMRSRATLKPCTPFGVMALLDLALSGTKSEDPSFNFAELKKADLSGKSAVVVGRSILVGKPMAFLLLERNATVTVAHSKTKDLAATCREADILIAAVGVPNLVKADWVKPGAVVIDVGINRLESGPRAGKLTGDVDYEGAFERAKSITPVPGGVGPMTVAMLMHNTLSAYKSRDA